MTTVPQSWKADFDEQLVFLTHWGADAHEKQKASGAWPMRWKD